MIAKPKWNELRTKVGDIQPADIADLLMRLEKRDRVLLFRAIPRELSANAFSELSHIDAQHFLHDLSDEETRALLAELEPDDRAELLEELPGVVVQKLLNLLDPGELAKTQALLGYPEESTGRLMTPGYVAMRPTWTATEALAHVRKRNPKSETVDVLYVTDEKWRLLGVLSLRQLILEEETTEDFYKSAAVETLKMDLSDASVGILYRSRIGWLVVLIFINIIAGAIIAHYEDTITEAIVLISFLPLLTASAGNAGSQAATLAIRALAVGDIRARDWFQITAKELAVATSLGITMGFVVWWLGIWRAGPQVAIVVTLTMMIVVMIGSIIGISLPFLLRKLKMDPAVASAPLVATVSDVFGVLVYFALASAFLGF